MNNNYLLSIVGCQSIDDMSDKIELTTVCSYVKKGDVRYIAYNEYEAQDCLSKKTVSILKIKKNSVTLIKNSDSNSRLLLELGKRHRCFYNVEYGIMELGVYTKSIDSTLNDNGGTLDIKYSLDLNYDVTSLNKIHLEVWRVNNNNVKDTTTNKK